MKHGFCPWRMDSISGETGLAQKESLRLKPKWEHDLRGIMLFG